MKAFLAILLLVSGFWAGHVYSSFHVTNELLPSLQRSQSLHLASLMLRSVELLDKGEVVDLRTKLIGLARSEVEPPPSVPTNWRAMLGSPFHGRGVLDDMKVKNESSAAELKRRLELLDELQANQGAERAR